MVFRCRFLGRVAEGWDLSLVLALVLVFLEIIDVLIPDFCCLCIFWDVAEIGLVFVIWGMRLGGCYKLKHFEGVGILCAGGCDAEIVAIGKLDFGGLEAEDAVDVDTEAFVRVADCDSRGTSKVPV